MPRLRCPICQQEFSPDDTPAMPFCSERCRLIDLGRWLDERYGLEYEPEAKPETPDGGLPP